MRLDSKFFIELGPLAKVYSGRWPLATVRDVFGQKNIRLPNIFERIPAASEEFGKRILVPYDCFRYMPYSNDILSESQVGIFHKLEISRGWLLIVCSGRNLGPVAFADRFLERFVLTHDMIRICVEPNDDLYYFAAVMHTKLGQALIRRDRNGSVIDHLDDKMVGSLRYPVVNDELKRECAKSFRRAFELREEARLQLHSLATSFSQMAGVADCRDQLTSEQAARRFTVNRSSIQDRFDPEPFAPRYTAYRELFKRLGPRQTIGDMAFVSKPPGRYRTLYVEDESFGVKLMSGRQVAQFRPIGLKVMGRGAWKRPEDYFIRENMILMTADGRAEENLGDCALVKQDRAGWAASGHVHRLFPKPGVRAGLLYLACTCKPVQEIVKSLATGSVVDALSVEDVRSVPVPPISSPAAEDLASAAESAWGKFAAATESEDLAIRELEAEFSGHE